MKPRNSIRRILPFPALILAGAAMLAGPAAQAATLTWEGTANNLALNTNWVGSPTMTSGDSFIFGLAGAGGLLLNNDLTAAYNIGAITYNPGASAFVIGDGSATPNLGNTFALTGNVTNNSTSLQTINCPFTMTAVRTFTPFAGGGDIVLGGNLSGGAGGITKAGGGTLTLSAANTYTGATTISGGLLKVTGTSTGSAFAVSGAALGGTGTINGAVTVSATGSINLANNSVGTLALGSTLAITGTAGANNLSFDLGSGTTDMITVVGATSVTTALSAVINLNQIGGVATPITPGAYTLIQGTGAMAAVGQFALATTKAFGSTYTLGVTGNNLQVTAAAGTPGPVAAFWVGSTPSSWNTGTNWNTSATSGSSSGIPGYQTNVTLATTSPTPNLTNTVDADFEINSLTFNSLVGGVTIAGTKMLAIDATAVNGNTLGNGITAGNTSGINTISAKVGLGSNQTWKTSGGDLTVSGIVNDFGGGYGLTKAGPGILTLSGANVYNGATLVNGGVLLISNANSLGTLLGGTTVASGAALQMGNITVGAEALTLNGTGISNDGALRSIGGGNYGGLITLGSPTRIQADAGVTLTISNAGPITGPTFGLTFGGEGNITLNSIIGTTSGTVTKEGSGTLTLSGVNTYTGATTVTGGTLKLGATGSAPNSPLGTPAAGTTVASGAMLDLSGQTLATAEALTLSGTGFLGGGALTNSSATAATYSGLVTLGASSSIVAASGNIILSNAGNITGSGFGLTLGGTTTGSGIVSGIATDAGTLTKIGSGTWSLSGTNTYTGGTTISGGALSFMNTNAKPASSAVTVAAGATLGLGVATSGSPFFTSTDLDALFAGSYAGVTLSATSLVGIDTTAGDFSYDSAIPMTAMGLNKLGANKLTLTAANSYTGPTVVTAGTLAVSGSGTFGNSASFDVTGTGTVDLGGTSQIVGPVNITAAATLSNGSLTGTSYAASIPSGTATVSANLLVNGSAGLTLTGAGTLNLSGANTFSGTTIVNGGILRISGAVGTISSSTAVSILNVGNLTLTNTNATEALVNRVSDTAGITVTNNGTLTFTNTAGANLNYAETVGTVDLASGQLNVVLSTDQNNATSNTQTLTLSGLTHTGATAAVTFSALGTAPNATKNMIKVSGATATTAGQIIAPWATTGTTAALQTDYAVYDASANIVPANIANSAETTWTGGATGNYTSTATANSLIASRSMNSWRYSNTAAGALTLGAFNFDTNGILNGNTGALTISGTGAVRQQGTAAANLYVNTGSGGITITTAPIVNNTGALTLVKNGSGTLTLGVANDLTVTNTYSGGTIINAGAIALTTQAVSKLGTGPVTVNAGATLRLDRNNMTGNLTLNGAAVTGGNGFGESWSGTITLGATSSIDSATTGTININADVSGPGGLTKLGANNGTLVLNGTNTYTGPTTVSAGVLRVSKPPALYGAAEGSWTAANITVASGATLRFNVGTSGTTDFTAAQVGTVLTNLSTSNNNGLRAGSFVALDNATGTFTFSPNITDSSGPTGGAVGLKKFGAGTLELAGANTYTGQTIFENGGTMKVSSFNSVVGGTASSSLGAPTTVANGTIRIGQDTFGGGTLLYTGTGETTDRVIRFAGQGSTSVIDQSGTGLLKFTSAFSINNNGAKIITLRGSTAGTGELAAGIPNVGTLSLTKDGTSIWTLSGANNYAGATTITNGSLVIGGAGQLGNGNYGGTIPISTGANLTYSSTAAQTLSGQVSGVGTLTVAGPGTLTLAAANSQTGAVTVSGGKLLVNGSTAAASAVTVASGATLGGTGTINGDVTLDSAAMALLSTTAPLTFKKLTLNSNVVHLALPAGLAEGVYTLATYTAATSSGAFAPTPVIDSGSLAVPGTEMKVAMANGIVTLTVGFPPIIISPTTVPNGSTIAFYSQALSAAGGYGAPYQNYTVDTGALPDGLLLSLDGVISGTPTKLGTFTFGVQVQDQFGFPAGYPDPKPQSYTMSIVLPNTFTWKNAISGDWNDASMWTNEANVAAAPAPAGQPDYTLNFTPAGTYTATDNLNDGFLLNRLNFAGAATLAGTNGLALTANVSTLPTVNQNSGSTATVNPPITMVADTTYGGSGNGQISLYGLISGAGSLTKNGAGTLRIYNVNNSFTGGTIINSGTLLMDIDAKLGTGPVTLNGGTLYMWRFHPTNALTVNGGTLLSENGFGNSWGGPITLNANFNCNVLYTLICTGDISGTGGVIKTGNGPMTLSGTNSYAGPTTVSAGILKVSKPAALYNAVEANWTATNITVASGATLRLNVGGASDFSGTQVGLLLTNLATSNNNGLMAGSSFAFDTANAGAAVVTVPDAIADSIGSTGGTLGLRKYGAGTLQLAGASTYTGQTILEDGGALSVASFNSVGTPTISSSLGRPTTVANGTIQIGKDSFGGGNLIYTGTGETTDRVISIQGQNATVSLSQAGTGLLKFTSPFTVAAGNTKVIALTGSTAGTGELAAAIPSHTALSLTKSGTGTWTLSGVNLYAGTTTINGGKLIIGGAGQLGGGTYAGNIPINGVTSNLTYNSTAAQTLSGAISGTGGLTQAGPGTLTLTGVNSCGTTTVSGGILVVNGTSVSDTGKLVISGSGKVEAGDAIDETVDTLFLGKVPQPAGTYSATAGAGVDFVDPIHFGGTGIVRVLTLGTVSPYATWADTYLPADVSNPAADNDGDGMTNQQEYAFGLNPTLGSSVSAITSGLTTGGMFTYTRRNPALTGLGYKVFTSLDLKTWTEDATASQTPDSLVAEVQTVSVTLTDTAPPTGGKLFVRVEAQ